MAPVHGIVLSRCLINITHFWDSHLPEFLKCLGGRHQYCESYPNLVNGAENETPLLITSSSQYFLPPSPCRTWCVGYDG